VPVLDFVKQAAAWGPLAIGVMVLVPAILLFLLLEMLGRLTATPRESRRFWLDGFTRIYARVLTAAILVCVVAAVVYLTILLVPALLATS
jgi:hypothetical protein